MLRYAVVTLLMVTVIPAYADYHSIPWNYFTEWREWAYNSINYYRSMITTLESEIDFLQDEIKQLERDTAEQVSYRNPILRGLIYGNVNYYIEPLPSWSTYDISLFDDYLNGRIEEGIELTRIYDKNLADFTIMWVKDYGDKHLGVAYSRTTATIGLGNSACGDWQHFDNFSITKIAWHEVGHVLGYGHSDKPNNIMYPITHTRYNYDTTIDRVIPPNWSWWYPFCNDGEQKYSLSTSTKKDGVKIIVLPPTTNVNDFIDNSVGTYYLCSEPETTWHKKTDTCNVAASSNLLITNHENNAVRVEGWIKNLEDHPDIDMQWDDDAYEYNPQYLDYIWELYNK